MFVIKHSIYLLREPIDCFGVQVNLSLICSSLVFLCSSNVIVVTNSSHADDTCIRDHNTSVYYYSSVNCNHLQRRVPLPNANDLNHLHSVKTSNVAVEILKKSSVAFI